MRRILYVLILVLAFIAPVDRLDIAKLQPIEAVAVYLEEGEVVLETDTGDLGRGATEELALLRRLLLRVADNLTVEAEEETTP